MNVNLPIKTSLILAFCLCMATVYSQNTEPDKGKVVIYFEPSSTVIIRLDTMLWNQTKRPVLLTEGKHVLRAWAPTKVLFVDTFLVKASKTTIIARTLKESEAHRKYRDQMYVYHVKKSLTTFVPLSITVLYAGYMEFLYSNNKKLMNKHLDNAKAAEDTYAKPGPAAISNQAMQVYNNEKDIYEGYRDRNNHLAVIAAISIPAAALATAVLIRLSKKILKPAPYTERPFLSLSSFGLKSDYRSTCSLGFVLNINR
jgi:hypothetical protein